MKYLLFVLLLTGCCSGGKERDCRGQEDIVNQLVKECIAEAKDHIDGDYEYRKVLDSCMKQYKELYCPYKKRSGT